ncbi:MAG: hypothetical protein KZY74_04840, partial [Paenibacillaceae bacterium]|nr:hypothetical protein [Paenibacillaceae bacterium]
MSRPRRATWGKACRQGRRRSQVGLNTEQLSPAWYSVFPYFASGFAVVRRLGFGLTATVGVAVPTSVAAGSASGSAFAFLAAGLRVRFAGAAAAGPGSVATGLTASMLACSAAIKSI